MNLLDKLERKFRRFAVSNVTIYLILGQAMFFILHLSGRFILERAVLIPSWYLRESGGASSPSCSSLP